MPIADSRVALPVGERQYHIDLGPGELAEYILLPGDPDRTAKIATALRVDRARAPQPGVRHRVTGTYRGQRVSVVSTGIGPDNVEIVVAEILAIVERPTFIRVGSCGALQPEIALGDLVITTGAVRMETTTELVRPRRLPGRRRLRGGGAPSIEAAAPPRIIGPTSDITATAPGFFGAQGRPIPQLPIRYPDLAEELARQRVLNFEMEASALIVLAGLARLPRRGRVRGVSRSGSPATLSPGRQGAAEAACVETGLEGAPDPCRHRSPQASGRRGSLATVARH